MPTLEKETGNNLLINVGSLSGIGSLILHVAKPLKAYTQMYARGREVQVTWDLRNMGNSWTDIGALNALLAIMHRMRKFSGRPQKLKIDWMPRTFGFWKDIGFLDVIEDLELVELREKIIGGFGHHENKTNPDTRIEVFATNAKELAQGRSSRSELNQFKDKARQELTKAMQLICEPLFEGYRAQSIATRRFIETVTFNSAEIALNAIIHGPAPAFVGVQRTSSRITISICDTGKGFPRSLHENLDLDSSRPLSSNINALLYGSLLRPASVGLRSVISEVIEKGGWVKVSCADTEIHWQQNLWNNALRTHDDVDPASPLDIPTERYIGEPKNRRVPRDEYKRGIWRVFDSELRGSRITIEIPIPE